MQGQSVLQRNIPPVVLATIAILVLTAAGQSLQSRVHLNHDVSWFVHFSGWLLQGRTLGTDAYSASLPMVWGLFMPPAALVHWKLLGEPAAVHLVFWAYFLASVALLIALLARSSEPARPGATGWVVAFVVLATLAPGFSFGQREHACVLFAMPYLALAVLRLQGATPPGRLLAVCVGVLAGIGFALKPHFLAVPALVELLLLARLGWRSLYGRGESLALGFTVLAYVVLAVLLLQDYLRFTLGITLSTVWAYESVNSQLVLQRFLEVAQPFAYGAVIAAITRTWSWQHTVLLVAGLGYAASYLVQWKGFVYHGYPVLVLATAFLGVCVGHGLDRVSRMARSGLRIALLAAVGLLALPTVKQVHDGVVGWYATYNIARGPAGQFRQAVIDTVNRVAPERTEFFFAFTTHPFPGFPTASYTAAEYSGRSIVQPYIPAYARLDEVSDPEERRKIVEAAQFQRKMVVEDLQRRPPKIVFVERTVARLGMNGHPFDDIAFYNQDPRFRELWQAYREYPPLGPLRVFLRYADPVRDSPARD